MISCASCCVLPKDYREVEGYVGQASHCHWQEALVEVGNAEKEGTQYCHGRDGGVLVLAIRACLVSCCGIIYLPRPSFLLISFLFSLWHLPKLCRVGFLNNITWKIKMSRVTAVMISYLK